MVMGFLVASTVRFVFVFLGLIGFLYSLLVPAEPFLFLLF